MRHDVSRRRFLVGTAGASAALAFQVDRAPAQKKAANLRLWILKTYVEPTNRAFGGSRGDESRGAQSRGRSREMMMVSSPNASAISREVWSCRALPVGAQ